MQLLCICALHRQFREHKWAAARKSIMNYELIKCHSALNSLVISLSSAKVRSGPAQNAQRHWIPRR
jgi:hypothetical protein